MNSTVPSKSGQSIFEITFYFTRFFSSFRNLLVPLHYAQNFVNPYRYCMNEYLFQTFFTSRLENLRQDTVLQYSISHSFWFSPHNRLLFVSKFQMFHFHWKSFSPHRLNVLVKGSFNWNHQFRKIFHQSEIILQTDSNFPSTGQFFILIFNKLPKLEKNWGHSFPNEKSMLVLLNDWINSCIWVIKYSLLIIKKTLLNILDTFLCKNMKRKSTCISLTHVLPLR